MTTRYMVGTNIDGKSTSVTVVAEDALIAALKVKQKNPRRRSPTCASTMCEVIAAIPIAMSPRMWSDKFPRGHRRAVLAGQPKDALGAIWRTKANPWRD